MMDQNTKDVLMILIPTAASIASALIAIRVKARVDAVAADVLRVEKATNSHATLLLEATRAAAFRAGGDEARAEAAQHG